MRSAAALAKCTPLGYPHPPHLASQQMLLGSVACSALRASACDLWVQAAEAWEAEKNLAKQLPATMVEELKAAAMAKQPGVVYPP